MKALLISVLLLAAPATTPAAPARDSILVMFWNLENFFDYHDSAISTTPSGTYPDATGPTTQADTSSARSPAPGRNASNSEKRRWTARRFYRKCNAIAKTIFYAADKEGRLPDAIGFAEVGNLFVLKQLLRQTNLRKTDYRIIHFDSPDRRGIDCALLYRASTLGSPYRAFPAHIRDSSGAVLPTRDILVVQFDSISILVNHHPSKLGGGKSDRRRIAMTRMTELVDSLMEEFSPNVLCIGDFNDNLWAPTLPEEGTIRFEGEWEKIDGSFIFGGLDKRERVLAAPFMLTRDAAYGGLKPLRTFSGPRYLGGVSDHLPILVTIYL